MNTLIFYAIAYGPAIVGGTLMIVCAAMWPRLKKRPLLSNLLLVLSGIILCIGLILAGFVWWRYWNPFIDMGPYHGKTRDSEPGRPADQQLEIYAGYVLNVFDPTGDEFAPTVRLLNDDGEVQWTIYATPDSRLEYPVKSIRFEASRAFPFGRPRVRGIVDWSFGREVTWWFITVEGDLKEYWFSW